MNWNRRAFCVVPCGVRLHVKDPDNLQFTIYSWDDGRGVSIIEEID